MNTMTDTNRRTFLVGSAAAGLSLGFHLDLIGEAGAAEAVEVNAWVVIKPDDGVVIRIARSELGQGTLTGLAQLVAEELECDWSKVTTEFISPGQNAARGRVWGEMITGGSRGIRTSHDLVRRGGATARMMLVQAAADFWGVPASECTAANSLIGHPPSGRRVRFGEVAAAAAKLSPPANVALKDPKTWRIAGRGMKRLDMADKVDGRAVYGVDVRLPGLLSAAISDCPVFGGRLKSFDAAVVGRNGVRKVVRVGDSAVAVIADTWWQAQSALAKLAIAWDEGPHGTVSQPAIEAFVGEGLTASEAVVGHAAGDAGAALAVAAKTIESVYAYPYQTTATMEPMNATALYTPDRCEVWCPTQNPEGALAAVVQASGLAANHCDVHKTYAGCGFGRRSRTDFVTQAVLIAKEMPGIPVKLIWSREQDMQHGLYHPISQCKLTGGLDASGNLIALRMRIAGASIQRTAGRAQDGRDPLAFQGLTSSGEATLGYKIPNLMVDYAMRHPHVPAGYWRAVNVHQNAMFLECFVDELAHAAGQDPLAFRRRLLAGNAKPLAVLDAVAARIGWDRPPAAGVSRGLAQFMAYGSYIAACAEVSVVDGRLKIHRIVAASDPGHAVNPSQIERQIEGSFAFGLSALMWGECTVNDGRIAQSNFHDYNSIRMAAMPKVEAIIMPSGGFWGGVGEPTTCLGVPAVLNAVFAATGRRIRSIPLKNHAIAFA